MAIGTGQVSVTNIATELSRSYGANTNISFADWSRKLWKGGPTDYATFKEVRYYGSNCAFSTVVTAQGTTLRSQTSPYAEIAANGMNATPCGIGEWKGYTHEYNASTETHSTIGRTGSIGIASPSSTHVAYADHDRYELVSSYWNTVSSIAGIAVWAEKDTTNGGTVYIKLDDVYGSFANGQYYAGADSTTTLQQLGPNDGAGQTTTANTTGSYFPATTLMKFTGADRITGCAMSLQSGLSSQSLSGGASSLTDPDGGTWQGSKVVTIDHDGTPGATSTITLGSTKIGYDICLGGSYSFAGGNYDQVAAAFGIEFNFIATNNDDVVFDTNSTGPTYGEVDYKSFKVTVYVAVYTYAEHDQKEN